MAVNSTKRSRSWCFTLNNFTDEDYTRIKALDVRYIIVGKEVGEGGTSHLQGYLSLQNAKTFSAVKRMFAPASPHIELAKGDSLANKNYCSKDGDVFEAGDRPLTSLEKGEAEKERWRKALECAKVGDFDSIDPHIQVTHCRNLEFIHNKYVMNKVLVSNDVLMNEWHWGPSGYGKSSSVRALFKDVYFKMKNKWWDQYRHEEVVVIDDIDPSHENKFGAFLKEWTDHYPFRAETKGSTIMIRPKHFIVTSQYQIFQVFQDPKTVEALERRFKSIEYSAPRDSVVYETDEEEFGVESDPAIVVVTGDNV